MANGDNNGKLLNARNITSAGGVVIALVLIYLGFGYLREDSALTREVIIESTKVISANNMVVERNTDMFEEIKEVMKGIAR